MTESEQRARAYLRGLGTVTLLEGERHLEAVLIDLAKATAERDDLRQRINEIRKILWMGGVDDVLG